jgi:hypothetical protein
MRLGIATFLVTIIIGSGVAWAGESAPKPSSRCFTSTQFNSWKAPDANTIYIRANFNRYFRLDLTKACTTLAWPDARLVLNVRGPQLICSPLDFDLKASQGLAGATEPCFVTKMTELSPAEIKALPQKFRP